MGAETTRNMWSSLQVKYTVFSCKLLDIYWHRIATHNPMDIKFQITLLLRIYVIFLTN